MGACTGDVAVVSARAIAFLSLNVGNLMRIKRHDKSHIVELEDGTRWRIWPSDIDTILQWSPTTELQVSAIDHRFCSHALIDQSTGSRVGVIKARAILGEHCLLNFLSST
jgi:hypothetical protein